MKEYRVTLTDDQFDEMFHQYYINESSIGYIRSKYGYISIDGYDIIFDDEDKYLSFIMTYM